MNRYLTKLAIMIYSNDENLPYRRRVEVAIFKDGKVLLTKNKSKESGDQWYGFPGGGTDGDTDEVAARKECLEEVGVAVRRLTKTSVVVLQEGIGNKDNRAQKYRGSRTRMFVAEYDRVDKSLLGDDGDQVPYTWVSPKEAERLLLDNRVDSQFRVKALREGVEIFRS